MVNITSCVFASDCSNISYNTKRLRQKIKNIDKMIREEKVRMGFRRPLRENGWIIVASKENCKRVWKHSRYAAEVEKARQLLVLYQRIDWLWKIRRELVQWKLFEIRVRALNREIRDDEAESKQAKKAKRDRIEEIQIKHKVVCDILGYDANRKEEDFSYT